MAKKISIAISACLLGHKVRYDGAHQANEIIQHLAEGFNIIPVCPEVEIGLGVPREKIELHQQDEAIHLLSCDHPIMDLSDKMIAYSHSFLHQHSLSGMILKDKSPSCGIENCKLYDQSGNMQRNGTGIFAATILQLKPDLPILQSHVVLQPGDLDGFIQQVREY